MNIYNSKREYDNIPLPENLDSIVDTAIRQANDRSYTKRSWFRRKCVRRAAVICLSGAAAIVIMSNISRDFVLASSKIPVFGRVVEIVTWQDYDEEDTRTINVRLPKIETTGTDDLQNRINNEIRVKINDVMHEAEERAEEYKKAFLDTGGKEEDWHQMEIYVDYEVECNTNNILSFIITKSESYASVYTEKYYYNIDLETGKNLTLCDLLGPDYVKRANDAIKAQIEKRVADGDSFFGYGNDDFNDYKFTTISDETKFYVNEDEQAVVVFDKYEIAPGYMGFVEFLID